MNNSNARKQQIKKYKDDDIVICEPKLKCQHWGFNPGSANFFCEKNSSPTHRAARKSSHSEATVGGSARGWGRGQRVFNGDGVSVWEDEEVLEMVVVIIA